MTGALLWNHWFWITLLTGSKCWSESLLIQPHEVPPPQLQSFATDDLAREMGQGDTDDDGETLIADDGGRNMLVSKSVSVSRVSVEMGGVRVAKTIPGVDQRLKTNNYNDNDSDNKNPQSFFQKLISQLKSLAADNSGEETNEESSEEESDNSSSAMRLTGGEEYTLVYRDEDYVGDEEYFTDEYLNYNYYYGDDDISDTYGDIIDINESMQGDYRSIDYNDNIEAKENDELSEPANQNHGNNSADSLVTGNDDAPDLVRPSPSRIRSDQARGRSLILPESDLKHSSEEIFKTENEVLKSEQIVFVKETKDIIDDQVNEHSEMDFVLDYSMSRPLIDLNIKIGIFVGVVLGILIITVLVVLVTRRKARSAKLVIDEDQSTTDSQFAFSRGLNNNSSIIQEHLSSHFGKAPCYPSDDLHSLDNDSFLTSLETMHGRDKLSWD